MASEFFERHLWVMFLFYTEEKKLLVSHRMANK